MPLILMLMLTTGINVIDTDIRPFNLNAVITLHLLSNIVLNYL